MKKGFTLIELLSVIIILAVILVVAVPRILKVIDSSKVNSYISNEKLVLKSAELYVSKNIENLPVNIGDTSEISLNTLITEGYIKNIKSPFNNNVCSGYVLIKKTEVDKYDYSPYINCINNTIANSIDDKLVLNYKFDDFQESSRNLIASPNSDNIISTDIPYEAMLSGATGYSSYSTGYGVHGRSTIATSAVNTFTFSVWLRSPSATKSTYLLYVYTGAPGGDGGWQNFGSALLTDKWQKITTTRTLTAGTVTSILIYRANQLGTIDICAPQFEMKPYATPYVIGDRISAVKDYSINSNNATLGIETTPKWILAGRNGKGSYEFNGNSKIELTNIETFNVRPNSEFSSNYSGYDFENNWTPTVSGGVLKLTKGTTGYWGSFGGGSTNLINGRTYRVTMRVRNQYSTGTQTFNIYNTSLQGNWPSTIVNKSTDWHEVSFYMTGNTSYGGWIQSHIGLADNEYYEIDWIRYDLLSNTSSDFSSNVITVSGWIKTSNTNLQTVVSMPYSEIWATPYYAYGIETQNNNVLFKLNINGADKSFTAGTITNDWHHVALTFDGNKRVGYIDGKEVASFNDTAGNITYSGIPTLVIGQKSSIYKENNFIGLMDDIRVYSRALSEDEIKLLYESTK